MKRLLVAAAMLAAVGVSFASFAVGQSAAPPALPAVKPAAATPAAAPAPYHAGANAAQDAERAKIWESPQMLRARAWVKDYTSHSAKITPGVDERCGFTNCRAPITTAPSGATATWLLM